MEILFKELQQSDILGHVIGFMTGLLFGIRTLRGVEDRSWKGVLLRICLVCWIAMITTAVLINVFAEDLFLPEISDLESAQLWKYFCEDHLEDHLDWEDHLGKPITYWEGLQETIKNEMLPKRVHGTREFWSNSLDEETIRRLREQLELYD